MTYTTSIVLQVYNHTVREQFYARYGDYPLLSIIDIVYPAHGWVLNLLIASQLFFWGFSRTTSTRIHLSTRYFTYGLIASILVQLYLIRSGGLELVDLAINLAYAKICISFLKYLPQIYHNYMRKSCHGFSIFQSWLDFGGGVFSVVQLFLDNYIDNDRHFVWSEMYHNKGKLGLSLVTFFFDFCFATQYYVLYKEHRRNVLPKKSDDVTGPRDYSSCNSEVSLPQSDAASILNPPV